MACGWYSNYNWKERGVKSTWPNVPEAEKFSQVERGWFRRSVIESQKIQTESLSLIWKIQDNGLYNSEKAKYNDIQDVIYGKVCVGFLGMQNIVMLLNEFETHMNSSFPTIKMVMNNLIDAKNRETCANVVNWWRTFRREMICHRDFLVINERHFLRTPEKKNIWDTFKIGYYKKKYLYNNFNEAKKINKLLKSGVVFNEKSYSKSGIARQMIRRTLFVPVRVNVQAFHDKNCRRF